MSAEPAAVARRPWHLPGIPSDRAGGGSGARHEGRTPGGQRFTTPRLDSPGAAAVADAVRSAALRARRERTLSEVVAAVSRAATRLVPAEGGARGAVPLLTAELGWSEETATDTLREMGRVWTGEALWSVVRAELPDPAVLDAYRPAPLGADASGRTERDAPYPAREPSPGSSRLRRAAGPPLLLMVNAGNVPGVAVTSAIRGLLVRSGVLCKASEEEPGLLALFAAELEAEDALLGACLATTWWPGEEETPAWREWGKRAGKAIVYGGVAAVAGVRGRLPAEVEVVAYGPKVGLGVVLPDAARGGTAERAAEALARDAWAYEQQGCVSPRLVYVLGDPASFAGHLAEALRERSRRMPRSRPTPAEAVAIRALRSRAEFRELAAEADRPARAGEGRPAGAGAAETEGGRGADTGAEARAEGQERAGVRLLRDRDDLSWTVLLDPAPSVRTGALPGVVRVHPAPDVERLLGLLAPLEGRIQSVGYAGEDGLEALAEGAARLGVARVSPFGTVAWPPADWRHDGRPQLLPLLGWTDWERPASR